MSDPADFLKGATVEYGGMIPNNGGYGHLFGVNTLSDSYWFNAELKFAENGNDFAMLIGWFGRLGRMAAIFKSFDLQEIEAIQIFLEAYFSSNDIPYFSSTFHRPMALQYRNNWIIKGNGELYESTGLGFRPML